MIFLASIQSCCDPRGSKLFLALTLLKPHKESNMRIANYSTFDSLKL